MAKQEGTVSSPGYTEVTIQSQRASGGEKKFQEIFQKANNMGKFCPVRDIIARVSDKWSLLAIYALGGYGTLRFNELKHRIGDISQRMLTVTLRNLEKDGLINKKQSYKIEHKEGQLLINGKLQPASVYDKYRSLLEKHKKLTIEKKDDDYNINTD